jgi:histidinol-phosphate aminotransferase
MKIDPKGSAVDKSGGVFAGMKLLLCENPLPPIDEAIEAAARELPLSNHYAEPYSWPLREALGEYCSVPDRFIHVNAGSETILRQLLARFGQNVHLVIPTYALFEDVPAKKVYTFLDESQGFQFNPEDLEIAGDTTLSIIFQSQQPHRNGAGPPRQSRSAGEASQDDVPGG